MPQDHANARSEFSSLNFSPKRYLNYTNLSSSVAQLNGFPKVREILDAAIAVNLRSVPISYHAPIAFRNLDYFSRGFPDKETISKSPVGQNAKRKRVFFRVNALPLVQDTDRIGAECGAQVQ